ncbi:MAG: hypothetical protein SVQ76_02165 [Candidatus Nanohaloarchaea archaeon]|nr:hypothetical protein [Candidatus Nanohaloarchaea archaeon]
MKYAHVPDLENAILLFTRIIIIATVLLGFYFVTSPSLVKTLLGLVMVVVGLYLSWHSYRFHVS